MDRLDIYSKNYSCETRIRNLVDNELLSDIRFEVGDDKITIYAHQLILSLGSPVFYRMFYGDLKPNNAIPISVPDLIPTCFKNMIRYIYGGNFIMFDLKDIYGTYKSCDKYLVYYSTEKIYDHVKRELNILNCCLIYDQLFKIDNELLNLLKNYSKKIIQFNSKSAIESKFFLEIELETLINILQMKNLEIDEIDLLYACEKWLDSELSRRRLDLNSKNKQDLFKLIRKYFNYDKLTINQLSEFKTINNLFTDDEIGKLFLHLSFNSPFIEYSKISRASFKFSSINTGNFKEVKNNKFFLILSSNKDLIIKSFQTSTFNIELRRKQLSTLSLVIYENDEIIKDELHCRFLNNDNAKIEFDKEKFLLIKANAIYKIVFHFNKTILINFYPNEFKDLNKKLELKYKNSDNEEILFNLNFKEFNHIEKIEFCTL